MVWADFVLPICSLKNIILPTRGWLRYLVVTHLTVFRFKINK